MEQKPNQTRQWVLNICLPLLVDHPLCPVTTVLTKFRALGPAAPRAQAFPMTGPAFNRKLKALTSHIGVSGMSSHSLHWGGAMWALSSGIPGVIVEAMGDWKSVCYLVYLDKIPQTVIDHYRQQFAHSLPHHTGYTKSMRQLSEWVWDGKKPLTLLWITGRNTPKCFVLLLINIVVFCEGLNASYCSLKANTEF